tara:strand:+ start:54568 stop:54951 length:384 start_codon:yes stop_codon:yes gene_type:complete
MKYLKKFNEEQDHNHVEMEGGGLKCDNTECNWEDQSISIGNYAQYINYPCPQCGENVLTQEDFDEVQNMISNMGVVNQFSQEELDELEKSIMSGLSPDQMDKILDLKNLFDKNDGRVNFDDIKDINK